MTIVIDGKALAKKISDKLKKEVEKYTLKPGLAVILANNDPASKIYVSSKEKKSLELGFSSFVYKFDENTKEDEIINLIKKLNNDNNVNGILVQLPLFKHLDKTKIIETIDPKKDVDGFHPLNIGKLCSNLKPYAICCTPKGIMKIFEEYNIELLGKNIVVIGKSNIVGRPLAILLINQSATVTIANSKTKNLKEITKNADIIISATGKQNLITADMVSDNCIVIDVGITRKEDKSIVGDVDFNNVKDKAAYITPVPGGVGPMTIISLMENTFELFLEQNKNNEKL